MAADFFDTSALIKRQVRERGNDWVRSLTRPKAAHTIHLSRITAVEVYAAIARRQRGGTLTTAQGGAILGHFRRHLSQRHGVRDRTPLLLADARLLARKHGLRAYDAVQLAAAIEVNRIYQTSGISPGTLVSADQELNAATVAEGLLVEDPNRHP
jgi:predicted nucleic acid-binding protein